MCNDVIVICVIKFWQVKKTKMIRTQTIRPEFNVRPRTVAGNGLFIKLFVYLFILRKWEARECDGI